MRRAVSTRARCLSNDNVPRILPATTAPIADSNIATSASAISASMRVNPAHARSLLRCRPRHKLDPPGKPIHPYFIPDARMAKDDGAAAGHSRCEEADGRKCPPVVAALRQQRFENDIV